MLASKLLMAGVMLFAVSLGSYGAEYAANCPVDSMGGNVFDASVLLKNSRISIESGTEEYPVVLDLYQAIENRCRKKEFARYPSEGGSPMIESIFFITVRDHLNVFSIVSWGVNNHGEGTYGRFYQVYAYHFDENEELVENKRISEDGEMMGIEGYVGGRESRFRYKTALEVEKYWRGKY